MTALIIWGQNHKAFARDVLKPPIFSDVKEIVKNFSKGNHQNWLDLLQDAMECIKQGLRIDKKRQRFIRATSHYSLVMSCSVPYHIKYYYYLFA